MNRENASSAFFFALVTVMRLGFADDCFFGVFVDAFNRPLFKGFRSRGFAVGFGWGNACDFNVYSFACDEFAYFEFHRW